MRYRGRHEDEREGGREGGRVRKTQREIPNTNVETLKTVATNVFGVLTWSGGSQTHMTTP